MDLELINHNHGMYVYGTDRYGNDIYQVLLELLKERESDESISHKRIPTLKQHINFIDKNPYKKWYMIYDTEVGTIPIGSIYLSHNNEIGVSIFKKYRRKGYAKESIKKLIDLHGELDYRANINPKNIKSIELFKSLGFKEKQITYSLNLNDDA